MTLARGHGFERYLILKNLEDYPGKYVVRLSRLNGAATVYSDPLAVTDTLEDARAVLDDTDCLLCLPRGPDDDKHVIESWV